MLANCLQIACKCYLSAIMENYSISVYLDKRRKKSNGTYPVKILVCQTKPRKNKMYGLDCDLTEEDFKEIWINEDDKKFRKGAKKDLREFLFAEQARAKEVAKKLKIFTFSEFENLYLKKVYDTNGVKSYFDLAISEYLENGKIGTAESYKYTINSFGDYLIKNKTYLNKQKKTEARNKALNKLMFTDITPDWLNKYEKFMLSIGKSHTTISIYTRTLRVIFNNAINAGDITKDVYPFGTRKGQYKVKKTKKVKKALTAEELSILYKAEVVTEQEQRAKDFWFFSYACNGMNLKDILLLKYSDITNDSFTYERAKTFEKSIEKSTITIYLTEFTSSIIDKYGTNKKGFVFDVLNNRDTQETQYKKIKNFTRFINDHIKRIAKREGLPAEISSYWARHSFTTISINKGASMEFISEALNHSDLSVTKSYFAGFEDKAKKEFAKNLMDF